MSKKKMSQGVPFYEREPIKPKNKKQKEYINAVKNFKIVVSTGVAGSGKTMIAAYSAVDMLDDPREPIEKIVIARPNEIEGTKSIGFLKGTLEDKMGPLVAPVAEHIKNRMGGSRRYQSALESGKIELLPLEYIKGINFNNCFVIIDEAEDIEWPILKTLLLRIGQDCRVVINGDIRQTSISRTSGLATLLDLLDNYHMPINYIDFDGWEYCVRSDECRLFGQIFEEAKI